MEFPIYVLDIQNKLPNSYIVGGAVRDILLGKIPNDFDITSSVLPEEVKKIFLKVISVGEKHSTVYRTKSNRG